MTARLRSIAGGDRVVAACSSAAAARGCRRRARRRYPAPSARSGDSLYITSGTTRAAADGRATALAARPVLDPRDSVLRRREAAASDGRPPAAIQAGRPPRPDYPLLYPLLDLTTTLDPVFNIAYRFGSIFLAEPYPGGAGRPDLAITLLEKGLARSTR